MKIQPGVRGRKVNQSERRLRPRNLLQDLTQHDGVDDEPHNVLHHEDGDGGGALLRDHAASKADSHLDLDGEQEGRGERPKSGRQREGFMFCVNFSHLIVIFHSNRILRNIIMKE